MMTRDGSFKSPINIPGIYQFVYDNPNIICEELTNLIPFNSIVNYQNDDFFNIMTDSSTLRVINGKTIKDPLRVETRDGSTSQAHCYISDKDDIFYITQPDVMNIIINFYTIERRNNIINDII